jgi:DNA topoisomerase I
MSTLIIVESPAKAKKIKTFYKNDNSIIVKASYGHICDLDKKTLSIDTENNFKPNYKILSDKNKIIKDLKSVNNCNYLLAADDDREGDAIAWHCGRILKIDFNENNRITFNEISKKALDKAIKNPTKIDLNSVNAQQARRIIDRLFGYKLSPLLWKHIDTDKMGLSAGRVQSCLLDILNKHQEKILNFKPTYKYDCNGTFKNKDIILDCKFIFNIKNITNEIVKQLFNKLLENNEFIVEDIKEKTEKSYAPPPFITSTLQQSAQNTYGFSVKQTMMIAQKLYDNGKITYMRTDSVYISDEFKTELECHITDKFGRNYYKNYNSKKKVKGAQEAHEAIRPTKLDTKLNDNYTPEDNKLYNLILKRTITSHMKEAIYDVLIINLTNKNIDKYGIFTGKLKSLKFDGYLKYDNKEINSSDIELYKTIKKYNLEEVICNNVEVNPPQYYNESSIVKKLESSGIGRPSTYSNIINTLYTRDYTIVKDIEEELKEQTYIKLSENRIEEGIEKIKKPKQSKRIIVTELGKQILEYLLHHFSNIINIEFTNLIENDLDKISCGKLVWTDVVKKVYNSFSDIVEKQLSIKTNNKNNNKSGRIVLKYKNNDITLLDGKFGPFLNYDNKNYSVTNYLKVNKKKLENLKENDFKEIIKYPLNKGKIKGTYINILLGPHGYYLKYNNKNIKISQNKKDWNKEYIINLIK